MLVKNFGHLWERQYLFRGKGSVRGHLKGRLTPKSEMVDFRDQIGVYVLYDKNLVAVYVGQAGYGDTSRLLKRLKDHENDHLWNRWTHFSWYGFRKSTSEGLHQAMSPDSKLSVSGSEIIEQLEALLISVLEPKLNKQGASWKSSEEYYQYIEPSMQEASNASIASTIQTGINELKMLLSTNSG